jgi:hypothetical protein
MKTDAELIIQNKNREIGLTHLNKLLTTYMLEVGMFQTCLNCCDWNDTTEMCIKFNARPPAKIIVSGCEHHTDIPY